MTSYRLRNDVQDMKEGKDELYTKVWGFTKTVWILTALCGLGLPYAKD